MTPPRLLPQKNRRDVLGGERGKGNKLTEPVRRRSAASIRLGAPDPSLTSAAGLAAFDSFVESIDLDRVLRDKFDRLKSHRSVIYRMSTQIRLLVDLFAMGEDRVFSLESVGHDALFNELVGGSVPDVSTVYRDLRRFDEEATADLTKVAAEQGQFVIRAAAKHHHWEQVHLDIDTSVLPVFGDLDGSGKGHNPRYHARPSYQMFLAHVAEANAFLSAELLSGATSLGGDDAVRVTTAIERTREAVGPSCVIYVRIDAAADCAALLRAIELAGAHFLVKMRATPDLKQLVGGLVGRRWTTTEHDIEGRPLTQVAETGFWRQSWTEAGLTYARVVAVRTREERSGKQLKLWDDDWTVQVFVTSDPSMRPEDVQQRYHGRAGIEPKIGELKRDMAAGKMCSEAENANKALLLLRVLTFNLIQRWVQKRAPWLRAWGLMWLRRAVLSVAGRLSRHAGSLRVHVHPRSELLRLLE